MLSKRSVWLVGGILLLLIFSSFLLAVESDEIRAILRDGRGTGSSGDASFTPLSSGRESVPLPPTPLHPLSASQTIYIYVILTQPEWLPPPPHRISEHSCEPPLMEIKLDSLITGAERYNIYRDTLPMFYREHYDSTHNLIGHTTTRYFDDFFSDPLWYLIGSRGVCDPAINYYYIVTSLDSLGGGVWTESQRPSNCAGEFDFRLYEGINWISYALDIGVSDAGVFADRIPGAKRLDTWDNTAQVWRIIARWSVFPPPGQWDSYDTVAVSYPYRVFIPSLEDTIFTLAIPGLVPVEDPHFWLKRGYNFVTLPFRQQRSSGIVTGADLGADIGRPPADRIVTWDAENKVLRIVARWSVFPPPGGWESGPGHWGEHVRPGYPYMVYCTEDGVEPWPPIAR